MSRHFRTVPFMYLNTFHRHPENAKKGPSFYWQVHIAMLLTTSIYHRIDSEYCSQSENGIHYRMLADLF